jgi:MFS family permease
MGVSVPLAGDTSDAARITPLQLLIVAVCVSANMLDGYDVFIMGYALPHLPEDFATTVQKGYLISAALIGMGLSAMFLARLADTYGRRPALIGALAVNLAALLASATADSFTVLIVARFFTGIAMGVIGVTCVVIAQEMMPSRLRSSVVGIVMGGYPIGSFVAGLAGAGIVGATGWTGLFWVGLGLNFLVLVAMIAIVPETAPFLERSASPKDREAALQLRRKIALDPTDVPAATTGKAAAGEKVNLLSPEYRGITLKLWVGYAFLTAAFYFVASWTPQLITNASGGDKSAGALAGIMISVGTIIGALVYAWVGARHRSTTIAWAAMGLAMLALIGFAVTLSGGLALAMALMLGLTIYVTVSAYTTIANAAYPVLARSKGYGMVLGVGRIGAIVSPILGGYAATIAGPQIMYLSVLLPLALVGLCAMLLGGAERGQKAAQAS